MSYMQLYPDSLPDYPDECMQLQDFGFKVVPYLGDTFRWMNMTFWSSLSDVWVIVSVVTYLVINVYKFRGKTLFFDRQLAFRRFMLILSIVYFLRAIIIPDTRYPGLIHTPERYNPDTWILGAILMMSGIKATGTDFMFSGHTAIWVLTASMVSKYTDYKWGAVVFWIFNGIGVISLMSLEMHYLADIVVSIAITKLVFWCYHLFFDWPINAAEIEKDTIKQGVEGFYARFYKNMLWLDGKRYK